MQAKAGPGIYRCGRWVETKRLEDGENLPVCSCNPQSAAWRKHAEDNYPVESMLVIDFTIEGKPITVIYSFKSDEIPEAGNTLNLISKFRIGAEAGLYEIVSLRENNLPGSDYRAHAKFLREIDEAKPIYVFNRK